jgi:hypothetical protein
MSIQNLLKAPSDGRFTHFVEGDIPRVRGKSWARKLQDGQCCHPLEVVVLKSADQPAYIAQVLSHVLLYGM